MPRITGDELLPVPQHFDASMRPGRNAPDNDIQEMHMSFKTTLQ